MKKIIAAGTLLAAAAAVAFYWRVVYAAEPTQTVETRAFVAQYPAAWEPIDPKEAAQSTEAIFITSWRDDHRPGRWDPPRIRLRLEEATTGYPTLDALVAGMRSVGGGPPRELSLGGGARGVAWTEDEAFGVHGAWMTFYDAAIQAPDGRLFRGVGTLPGGWLLTRRFERIYARILASVRFKPR